MFKAMLDVSFDFKKMSMEFINETKCSQNTEHRTLDSIRVSLLDPECTGPEIVYGINMDVYQENHLLDLQKRNQLYGIVQETMIKETGAINVVILDKFNVQVIIGPQVHIVKNQIQKIID